MNVRKEPHDSSLDVRYVGWEVLDTNRCTNYFQTSLNSAYGRKMLEDVGSVYCSVEVYVN